MRPATVLALVLAAASPVGALAQQPPTVQGIVDEIAGAVIANGQTVGVAVAVVMPGAAPRLFTYGDAVRADGGDPARPFAPDTLSEIGSVTKVFTTNLLGQLVWEGRLKLNRPLSSYREMLGRTPRLTSEITLRQLADFTAGLPDYAPLCSAGADPRPGCLPSQRPTIAQYGAREFGKFFRHTAPRGQGETPPTRLGRLPAPYFYSDYSIGLLGLVISGDPKRRLSDAALTDWSELVGNRILGPLGMTSTSLFPPPAEAARLAKGYDRAIATPVVAGAQVASATLVSRGSGYHGQPPAVTILGGGGAGAAAVATVADGQVRSVRVTAGGAGYIEPAKVNLAAPGVTQVATARIVVEKGRVTAVLVNTPGAGYASAPAVTVTGGRPPGQGRDATLVARMFNGAVASIEVTDGGEGYVEPLTMLIEPGAGLASTVPIWAPAGALKSSIADMGSFAAAALGRFAVNGTPVPTSLRAGFGVAETPSACQVGRPALRDCPPAAARSALAWEVLPGDAAAGVPSVVIKNGALPGFSTQVMLMPASDFGVVAFTNSEQTSAASRNPIGPAATVARNVLFSLFFRCVASPIPCN